VNHNPRSSQVTCCALCDSRGTSAQIGTGQGCSPAARVHGARAYGRGEALPPRWWRKIVIDRGGIFGTMVLVYQAPPADLSELVRLMWGLQVQAPRCKFTITVITPDGISTDAPPIALEVPS
jgi:hypothetical protein